MLLAQAERIKQERAKLLAALNIIGDVRAYSSEANFVLFRVAHATQVFEGLKQRGILIKNLNGGHPALTDCLRVTVGTPEEDEKFIAALQDTLNQLA